MTLRRNRAPARTQRAPAGWGPGGGWRLAVLLMMVSGTAAGADLVPPAGSPPSTRDVPEIRAQLTARRSTVLSAEISAKIADLSLQEGERFAANEVLVGFDCALYQASLDKAAAQQQAKRKTFEVHSRLDKLGSVSALDIGVSAAELAAAAAETALAKTMVDRCSIRAPFAGRVAELKVKRWQSVAPGEPILQILDDRDLEVEMIVPSRWLAWLKAGAKFTLQIDEIGRAVEAEVVRFAAAIDPVSQSIKLFGRVRGTTEGLIPGMSGVAAFAP